jgi:hypothetical protein
MPDYRIYSVHKSGRIAGPPHLVTCDTDEEIIKKAKSMVNGLDLEIWDLARVVAKISSKPTAPTAV